MRVPRFSWILLLLIASACATERSAQRLPSGAAVSLERYAVLPPIAVDSDGKLLGEIEKTIQKSHQELSKEDVIRVSQRMQQYILFLGLTAKDFKKASKGDIEQQAEANPTPPPITSSDPEEADAGDDDHTPSNLKAIRRLFAASTQFLYCADLTDWDCLEQKPKLRPSARYRQESVEDLGQSVNAGKTLEMEYFFTEGWDGRARSGLVDRLAERLHTDAGKSLALALYGIDDIAGSMKPVYDELVAHHRNSAIDTRAVVDVSGVERPEKWVFDYVPPVTDDQTNTPNWLFGKSKERPDGMHVTFQYIGTPDLIREFNRGIGTASEAKARIEWPVSYIMHNKFAVLESESGARSVWTGTANFSNRCMGTETNANMAIYIKNDSIAQAYLAEFNHMYEFDSALNPKSKLVMSLAGQEPVPFNVGHFHRNKVPVSKRLFTFDDGTRVRVHFAPTDDAEHRVILPMLLSAKAGDVIRISMFGGTGYEIVRAMQFAVAQGADVRIVFDRQLGFGKTSWIRDRVLNLFKPNPYLSRVDRRGAAQGTIEVRLSTWKGKNHYKVGTLSRKQADGRLVAEQIIVGSQNWSSGGNDANDENVVSIQNFSEGVEAAQRFNVEFDERLWEKAKFFKVKSL